MPHGGHTFSCAVITMSDKGSAGLRDDTSGRALQEILRREGYFLQDYRIIPDTIDGIIDTLKNLTDDLKVDLIVTTGGTGVSPSDVTPEAMRQIIDFEIPGMAEAMRSASLAITPRAVLSRAMAGVRNQCLIINLPGSEKAARENIAVLLPALPHALEKIKGEKGDCGVL